MIQATGLTELRDNVRVYFPQSFNLPPPARSTVKIRFGGGRVNGRPFAHLARSPAHKGSCAAGIFIRLLNF